MSRRAATINRRRNSDSLGEFREKGQIVMNDDNDYDDNERGRW